MMNAKFPKIENENVIDFLENDKAISLPDASPIYLQALDSTFMK